MEGWIKLHRKLLGNPIIVKDSDYLSVWIYVLLNATHKEYDTLFQGKRITLQKGQLITGRKSISEKLKINESKVQRILKTLESEQQIKQQKGNKNRLITILSWDKYQQDEQQIEQQVNNNRTTSEQQVNTNKNVKNIKNIYTSSNDDELKLHFEKIWEIYPNKKGKAKSLELFFKWIKGRKINKSTIKLTDLQIYKAVKKYKEECEEKNTEQEYIKHGDTFFNKAILDYVEAENE